MGTKFKKKRKEDSKTSMKVNKDCSVSMFVFRGIEHGLYQPILAMIAVTYPLDTASGKSDKASGCADDIDILGSRGVVYDTTGSDNDPPMANSTKA